MSDKLKKAKQFLIPYIEIADRQRKIKAIADKYHNYQEFEKHVTDDEIEEIVRILGEIAELKKGQERKHTEELEAIEDLNEELKRRQNERS